MKADAAIFVLTCNEQERAPRNTAQFAAYETQLAHACTVLGKLRSDEDERFLRIIAAHFEQPAAVEWTQRRKRKIPVVHIVSVETVAPEERLASAIGPSAVESRRKCKRITRIDTVNGKECRLFARDTFSKPPYRAGSIRIACKRKANWDVGKFYRIDFPRPEQINSTASVAV